jgi:hypothetical protein
MSTQYTLLGQVSPSPNTVTNVYQTGASTSAIVGTITLLNPTDSNTSYSLIVRPTNQALAVQHHIIRGGVIPPRELVTITGAVTMNSNVVLACNTHVSGVTVQAFGAEIT